MDLSNYKKEIRNIEITASRVYGKLSMFTKNYLDRDDLVQAGYMGLMDAIQKNDLTDQDLAIKYTNIRIHGGMIDCIRQFTPLTKHMVRTPQKYPTTFVNIDDHQDEIEKTVINTNLMDLEDLLITITNPRERRILDGYLLGLSQKDIGIMEGIGESRVSQIMGKIVKDIKLEHLI